MPVSEDDILLFSSSRGMRGGAEPLDLNQRAPLPTLNVSHLPKSSQTDFIPQMGKEVALPRSGLV